MRKLVLTLGAFALVFSSFVLADVSMTDKAALSGKSGKKVKGKPGTIRPESTKATGSVALIDSSGFKWFINTNITFSTTSSASAAMSEASYTVPVVATTSGGGPAAPLALNDAYDGYQTICMSFTGAMGPCATGNPNYVFYNKLGPATADPSCPGSRQYIFPVQTTNGIQVHREVYVPSTDSFARWLNYFTNTTGAPITFNMITGNNLGSDSNTIIVSSSSGNAGAEVGDTWVTTFQNYSAGISTDPRLGHVFQGAGASTGLSIIHFANGDDNPYWGYTLTLQPGQTAVIMNFGVAQPTKALAAAKSASLATLSLPAATQCLSTTELSQIANFAASPVIVPTVGPRGLALLAVALAAIGLLLVRRLA